ncbi:ankyrin repeat-containing domain protein, partial [Mycena sanguinolenta]
MLREWEEPLEQLETVMRRLTRKANLTGQQFSRRLTWAMWGKDDVQQALNAVERYKSLFNTWLALDTWTLGQDLSTSISNAAQDNSADHEHIIGSLTQTIEANAEDHRIHQNYISQSLRTVARNQEQQHNSIKRNEIIAWFSPLNFSPRQADLFNARQPGTGGWLLETPVFKRWELGYTDTVWCRGIPGAGKTILCAMVVDHLRKDQDSENTRVAVIFLNHKETEAQSPPNILAAIWRQLVFEQPLPPTVEGLYSKHQEQRTRPSLEDIHSVLCSTASAFSRVFIVVDALDEYPEDLRNVLLQRLSLLGPRVSLMLTSRPHIDIKYAISNFETIEIRAAEHDIREYLEGQIRNATKWIFNLYLARFLLAKLHIDSLLTKHTVKAVREALKNMPGNLDGTYAEVVARINEQTPDDRGLAWLILSWMTHAKRPLRPAELKEALAVESGATELDPENLLDMDSILSVCAGLVIIHEEDDIIGLVHYTVQTYLERLAAVQFPHASTEITMTCITYLSFQGFIDKLNRDNPMNLFMKHAFLDYAVEYCFVHARGNPEEEIREEILAFLVAAAGRGHDEIIQLFLNHGTNINFCSRDGITALQTAAFYGSKRTVRFLIENGADVDMVGSRYGTALRAASFRGHYDIVVLLLEHGVDIDARKNAFGSVLQRASAAGHEEIVKILIEGGADVNAENALYGSALQRAAEAGHDKIVKMLIEHGAHINAGGRTGSGALQRAVEAGHGEIVKILIEHGADVNAGVNSSGNTLRQALEAGHTEVVKILVEHGADVNAGSRTGSGALRWAAEAGHGEIVKILIEHGADVNAEVDSSGNPLQQASEAGQTEVVKILVEHGA